MDWGFKVTLDGKLITSTDIRDYSVHSEDMQNIIRMQTSGSGSIDIDSASHTVTIPHGLGYPPFFLLYEKYHDRSGVFGFDTDYANDSSYCEDPYGGGVATLVKVDATNLYIRWYNPSVTNFLTIDYVYFIGRDPLE